MEEEYKTVAEIAEHFEVSETTVRNWIRRGNIPIAMRKEIGKKTHIVATISDVEDFIRPGIVKTASKMS